MKPSRLVPTKTDVLITVTVWSPRQRRLCSDVFRASQRVGADACSWWRRSHVCQRKGPRGLPVNILEAVCDGHACSNLHGARVPHDVRIGGEGCHCSSDEL